MYFLGASDFVDPYTLDSFTTPSLLASSKLEKHYLHVGDVVVLAKGHHGFTAHYIDGSLQPAVVSSVFLVLREIQAEVLPEYLVWYINLESTQNELKAYARGSALPAINRTILGDLKIDMPPLSMQHEIVALSQLKKEESRLLQKIDDLKTTQLELLLKTKIQNNEQ
ncbi:restriction endonuclease subunit S [Mesonia sp.]|uniref:restriction endonuclease subunit S n=1 Tax=Mesonia sp. TaxID=1960830 RepID=UPI0025B9C336|nr:restriction endonuclease subunit S [Mesonia sp.]